ncbi:MAG: hypothetical protein R3C05_03095 [Pirellulaceae bacterium]
METQIGHLRCPACRAKQPWRLECRRCQADLRLLVAALKRSQFVVQQLATDSSHLDAQSRERYERELELLSPNMLK